MPAEAAPYEHPARAAKCDWNGERVGRIFELHPSLVETGRAAVLDLDLRVVRMLGGAEIRYTPIRRYPSSAFDLSVIAGLREHAGKLESGLASFAGPLLESIEFVRAVFGAAAAGGTEERLVPPDGRLAPSGRFPRRKSARFARGSSTGMRGLGVRTARVSTRRAKPGGWVKRERGLCRWCGAAVPARRFTFCGDACVHEWKLRTDPGYLREQVFARDRGVCAPAASTRKRCGGTSASSTAAPAGAIRKRMGIAAASLGCRPHRPGGRRRRGMRPLEYADAVPEVSSRGDVSAAAAIGGH